MFWQVYNKNEGSEIKGDDKTLITGALEFSSKKVANLFVKEARIY